MVGMMIPGFIVGKCKLLESNNKTLPALLLYVAQPFMIVMVFTEKEYFPEMLGNILWMLLFSAVVMIVVLAIAFFLFRIKGPTDDKKMLTVSSVFSNSGFLGIPILRAMFPGTPAALYCAVFVVVFNILIWTVGAYIMSGEKKYVTFKKAFLNPPTIALVVALPLFFFNVQFNEHLANSIALLGGMVTPLAMIIVGLRLSSMKFKEVFAGWWLWICNVFKLFAAPLITFLIVFWLPIDAMVKTALVVIMAMPCSTLPLVIAEVIGRDGTPSVRAQLTSTILCILTIPLIVLITGI